jgi:hypothetical protein
MKGDGTYTVEIEQEQLAEARLRRRIRDLERQNAELLAQLAGPVIPQPKPARTARVFRGTCAADLKPVHESRAVGNVERGARIEAVIRHVEATL